MNIFIRWMTFNFVGALGTAVQLSVLALLDRLAPAHYLSTSAGAVELALLHNFLWHTRLTWADRGGERRTRQLLRFHLSNGLISLGGNFALMRLLVQARHLPVLVSSVVAIVCCGMVNFWLGDRWAFAESQAPIS
ncbi:MAG TPA: GtrA family protein [Bryobacteraceae bacterium]|jgi:putative flippase GtrA|nr:GtrA family protein [Bryobacteraceae bacterium]